MIIRRLSAVRQMEMLRLLKVKDIRNPKSKVKDHLKQTRMSQPMPTGKVKALVVVAAAAMSPAVRRRPVLPHPQLLRQRCLRRAAPRGNLMQELSGFRIIRRGWRQWKKEEKNGEQQKQVIQGALVKLDSQTAKKSQHIVFDSESEEESEKQDSSASNGHNKKMIKPIKAKLFDSSGEDSDDEEEKDDERFEIKTQYEGRSGEKLMALQSRFGTDERFKMDARFLEDNSEEETDTEKPQTSQADDDGLSAEKKKNLDILQSVLNINVEPQPTSKKAAKAKAFKDLNALQYDPTKEDHAVFERKAEEEKKESNNVSQCEFENCCAHAAEKSMRIRCVFFPTACQFFEHKRSASACIDYTLSKADPHIKKHMTIHNKSALNPKHFDLHFLPRDADSVWIILQPNPQRVHIPLHFRRMFVLL
ncbi:unnamed protein product [Ranitomeya imitator]|uniref:Uncharacterized protein n=1 Tax=Ranitomeya imitator TaxID=111125 RepID=A0ABN9KMF2_9NEOB|nr:unnamed protein product [Ranitomeya imitator]